MNTDARFVSARVSRRILGAAASLIALGLACGGDRPAGEITGKTKPPELIEAMDQSQAATAAGLERRAGRAAGPPRQVLFGDLHVHSTFSIDAFLQALPIFGGEGAHPPAGRPVQGHRRALA